jgi:hypothetical protein
MPGARRGGQWGADALITADKRTDDVAAVIVAESGTCQLWTRWAVAGDGRPILEHVGVSRAIGPVIAHGHT